MKKINKSIFIGAVIGFVWGVVVYYNLESHRVFTHFGLTIPCFLMRFGECGTAILYLGWIVLPIFYLIIGALMGIIIGWIIRKIKNNANEK